MIRSIVAPAESPIHEDFTPSRNLPREKLEVELKGDFLLWMDVVDGTEEEIRWLESVLDLHPSVVEDLMRDDRHPSLLVYPKYLFMSLFEPYFKANKIESKEIHCLIGDNYFVTVRKSDVKAADEAYNRAAMSASSWRKGLPYFLYLTIQYTIDAYYPLVDRISVHLNHLEEGLMLDEENNTKQPKNPRKAVYRTKQQLNILRQMVSPQREVLSNLISAERMTQEDSTSDLFRHLYERLLRIYDVIDAQRDLASNVIDMVDGKEASKLSATVSRLTILSMIFLPLTFFTGLFQLNFTTTNDPLVLPVSGTILFLFIVALMFISVAGLVLLFRRRGWI